ncbi:hypothetical protein IB61_06010 [Brucella abortus LMN2]|nr:hypothetical protein IB61_06010 [Brucella abortus LMN2]
MDDLHFFRRDEAALGHLHHLRNKVFDFFRGVHDFDDGRQILRKAQDFCCMKNAGMAKAERPPQYGRARHLHLAGLVDDGFV